MPAEAPLFFTLCNTFLRMTSQCTLNTSRCTKTLCTTVELNFPCDKVDVTRCQGVTKPCIKKKSSSSLSLYLLPGIYNILLA